ncbi:hypothetical protein P691DRAFT_803038 [Macrolepiota fuliginosa MF-IS2]|uniref:Uncharacterized protein n=1 Tax=Macrolepiota fuliginosa MF-IS2 TaxID=1400762 RepID=A0A9P5XAE2_9AGAR|nr:hypothetical protein P691DRAFT_803038 [Macrolepiota fuliginosa MF-IS2]
MFRASPWVPYQPSQASHQSPQIQPMDDDVDMDAPQISTLPEEKTPPPKGTRRPKQQPRKSMPKQPKPASGPSFPSWRKPTAAAGSDDEAADEPEEEEDQLIDDEDDNPVPTPASTSTKTSEAAPKKKAPAKRKSNKEPGAEDEGKKRTKKEKLSHPVSTTGTAGSGLTPAAPGVETSLSESHDDGTGTNTGANTPSISVVESEPQDAVSAPKPAKKKSTPRKTASAPKTVKARPSKLKMVIPALSSIVADDAASVMSEGGVSGTAASSPVTGNFEKSQPGSPEPEQAPPTSPAPAPSAPLPEEPNLENIPLPIYPLPSKPFPVQPPPKIPTGFAPPLPLDKGGKKVRHWRTAQREIRGIAGGRWFVRSWVGDKDSEYATSVAAKEGEKANGLSSKNLPSLSAPPLGRGSGKKTKGASLNASAAPSRDGSVIPDANPSGNATPIPITSTVRAPTKMRIQQLPEDPQSDAPMDTDPIPAPPSEP